MQGKKLMAGEQRLITLNNCIINSHNVWTNIIVLCISFNNHFYFYSLVIYVYFIKFFFWGVL